MKVMILIGLLVAGGVAFYMMGGPQKFGVGEQRELPETVDIPQSTFMGDAEANPFAQ